MTALNSFARRQCVRAAQIAFVLAAMAVRLPPAVAQSPIFTDIATAAGLTHVHTRPYTPGYVPTVIEEQSGGAAAGDFDGDGWPDLFVTRYWDSDLLYRNNRDGTFSDVTATAFPGGIGVHSTNGTAWGDVDNDGDLDLMVMTMNESRHLLYINDGAGRFAEEGGTRGITMAGGRPDTSGTSVSFGDYDRDGYLDFYVAEHRGFNDHSVPAQARLFRNAGAANPGHFVDVTAAAGVIMDRTINPWANRSMSFTPRFSDLDRDGHTDIAVVSDNGTTRMFWNNGDGTFSNRTAAAGINTGTNDMGFTLADFNGDGLLDWFASSISHDPNLPALYAGEDDAPYGNRLFLNNGNRTFTDATDAAGVRIGGWGWGADSIDFDNNGLLDIIHANGFAFALEQQSVFFENDGTRTLPHFRNTATERGIVDVKYGRGLLTFDFDRDGDLDVFISNYAGQSNLYRNDGGNLAGNWLQVRTIGAESNRDGVGAYITVTPDLDHPEVKYVTEVDGSSNFNSQSEMIEHFGLGQVAAIDQIDVQWPSGYTQRFNNVAINQRVTITEGLLADFNGDDAVDGEDLLAWALGCGTLSGATPAHGDANRDGVVDGADLLAWQRSLGRTVDSGLAGAIALAAVPEPAGLAPAALGLLAFLNGRRY